MVKIEQTFICHLVGLICVKCEDNTAHVNANHSELYKPLRFVLCDMCVCVFLFFLIIISYNFCSSFDFVS